MKRTSFSTRRSSLARKGSSDTAILKDEIQGLVRDIVIKRDGSCILRNSMDAPSCNGFDKNRNLILQADHLITRANSATYADTRLIVCVCKGHHGWKNWHQKEYEEVVRGLIGPERAALWERCERDSWRPHRTSAYDWKLTIAALKQELKRTNPQPQSSQGDDLYVL